MTQEEEIEKEADKYWFQWEKLTKREYFAALALQGLVAKYGTEFQESHSMEAVYYADSLINALNWEKEGNFQAEPDQNLKNQASL